MGMMIVHKLGIRIVALFAVIFLNGCGGLFGTLGQAGLQNELDAARENWSVAEPAAYLMTVRRNCFCPLGGARVDVLVSSGQVTEVSRNDTGEAIDISEGSFYPSVDGLHDILQDAIDRGAHSITASYHETMGYPVSFYIDYWENAVDEELGFEIVELHEVQIDSSP